MNSDFKLMRHRHSYVIEGVQNFEKQAIKLYNVKTKYGNKSKDFLIQSYEWVQEITVKATVNGQRNLRIEL